MLTATDRVLQRRIKTEEGFRHEPYRDTRGILTIGWGSNMHHLPADELAEVWSLPNRKGLGITEEQAQVFMTADIRETLRFLAKYTWWETCSKGQQRAFADMAYQLGEARFRGFRKMLRACKRGDWAKASEEALDSLWATQTPNRARRVAKAIKG